MVLQEFLQNLAFALLVRRLVLGRGPAACENVQVEKAAEHCDELMEQQQIMTQARDVEDECGDREGPASSSPAVLGRRESYQTHQARRRHALRWSAGAAMLGCDRDA